MSQSQAESHASRLFLPAHKHPQKQPLADKVHLDWIPVHSTFPPRTGVGPAWTKNRPLPHPMFLSVLKYHEAPVSGTQSENLPLKFPRGLFDVLCVLAREASHQRLGGLPCRSKLPCDSCDAAT